MEGYQRPSVWQCLARAEVGDGEAAAQAGALREFDNSVVSGFQLAALSGPMCEEPLMGVCFSVERWDMRSPGLPQLQELPEDGSEPQEAVVEDGQGEEEALGQARRRQEWASADCYGPVSGQLIAAMKEACRRAFQAQPQRLMAAMYTCEIMATADVLGKSGEPAADCCLFGEINHFVQVIFERRASIRATVHCTPLLPSPDQRRPPRRKRWSCVAVFNVL